jgi:hypothetical protein
MALVVLKKGRRRAVIDYRAINEITIRTSTRCR